MILAGKTVRIRYADGTDATCVPTLGDEVRFERVQGTALNRIFDGEGLPVWAVLGIVHGHLRRTGATVPDDLDAFADLLDPELPIEVVDEGKAEGTDPAPTTG